MNPNNCLILKVYNSIQWMSAQSMSRQTSTKTHYETLNVSKRCTPKEIREAFVTLSKKYHPDRNPDDPKSHARFVALNEAYTVLSKPAQRRNYDMMLNTAPRTRPYDSSFRPYAGYASPYEPFGRDFHRTRVKKVDGPGVKFIVFLILFTAVGGALQYFAMSRNSVTFREPNGELNQTTTSPPSPRPDTIMARPFYLRWIYRRSYDHLLEHHNEATAYYMALCEEVSKRTDEENARVLAERIARNTELRREMEARRNNSFQVDK